MTAIARLGIATLLLASCSVTHLSWAQQAACNTDGHCSTVGSTCCQQGTEYTCETCGSEKCWIYKGSCYAPSPIVPVSHDHYKQWLLTPGIVVMADSSQHR